MPKEFLEKKTKSGDLLIQNRIASGKSNLKKAGNPLYGKRHGRDTQKGKAAKKDKLNLKDVVGQSGIFDFYKEEKSKGVDDLGMKGSSPQDLIDSGFSAIEAQVKSDLLERLKSLTRSILKKSSSSC